MRTNIPTKIAHFEKSEELGTRKNTCISKSQVSEFFEKQELLSTECRYLELFLNSCMIFLVEK
jgi:hypothetical protein